MKKDLLLEAINPMIISGFEGQELYIWGNGR